MLSQGVSRGGSTQAGVCFKGLPALHVSSNGRVRGGELDVSTQLASIPVRHGHASVKTATSHLPQVQGEGAGSYQYYRDESRQS